MRFVMPVLGLLVFLTGFTPAEAQDGRRARQGVQSGEVQSLDRILSGIRREYPGNLSDVDGPDGGRYRIKWLTPDGRVLVFDTDARTGQVLGVQGDTGGGRGGGRERAPRGERFQNQRYEAPPADEGWSPGRNGNGRRNRSRDDDNQFQGNGDGGNFFGGNRRNRYR